MRKTIIQQMNEPLLGKTIIALYFHQMRHVQSLSGYSGQTVCLYVIIIISRRAGQRISETADKLGFSPTSIEMENIQQAAVLLAEMSC